MLMSSQTDKEQPNKEQPNKEQPDKEQPDKKLPKKITEPKPVDSRVSIANGRSSAGNLTMAAMLACLALIFSYVEFLIPISLGIPGIKLGLANLVIIIALYGLNWRYALVINVVRICLSGLLFSGVFGIMYSMVGGIVSFLVMLILIKSGKFSIVGVSMAGGVFHNLGQILVAAQLISNLKVFYYFPVLLFSGMATGIVIGFIAYYLGTKVPRQLFPNLREKVLG